MSKENVALFFEKVREDEGLKEKLKHLYSENDFRLEDLIQIAEENGYPFNEVDLEQMIQETAASLEEGGALRDEQLEVVAGGYSPEITHFLNWIVDENYRNRYPLFK